MGYEPPIIDGEPRDVLTWMVVDFTYPTVHVQEQPPPTGF